MLPHDKDEHFVGREDILDDIERKLTSTMTHCRTAIVGLGGVGQDSCQMLVLISC